MLKGWAGEEAEIGIDLNKGSKKIGEMTVKLYINSAPEPSFVIAS